MFDDDIAVDEAVRSKPHILLEQTLVVKKVSAKKEKQALPPPPRAIQQQESKLFVGGLINGIYEECLHKHFSNFGVIAELRFMKHPDGSFKKK
jgi:hypothetical protein